jgi:SDR family mycofactocin-dependent oxidoreductase
VRLVEEGADIIAVDICKPMDTLHYDLSSPGDLAETAALVEERGQRIVAVEADVREGAQLVAAVAEGVGRLGRMDVVVANAGVGTFAGICDITEEMWQEVIDVNLTGVWKTLKATIPQLIAQGDGGSIILTSSMFGLAGNMNTAHYVASKHGVVGLMRTAAIELAPHWIRVNTVCPTTVDTPMIQNEPIYSLFMGGKRGATREDAEQGFTALNALEIPWVDPVDVSNGVLYLASDEARYVTGTNLVIDAGAGSAVKIPHPGT